MLFRPLIMAFIFTTSISAQAEDHYLVDHVDSIKVSHSLSLANLVKQSVEKYPDYQLLVAMQKESDALSQRGNRWIAGGTSVYVDYKDDFAGSKTGAYEVDAGISIPLWNWGQRSSGQELASYSELQVAAKEKLIHLEVAGLLRNALWEIKMAQQGLVFAQAQFKFSEKLLATVKRRVDLGDLAKTDLLLVQSDMLQKKTELIQAEAETMHARKSYFYLTQSELMPEKIEEKQSGLSEITAEHPALVMVNVLILKKKSRVKWIKSVGSGQPTFAIGGNTERGARGEESIDSITFGLSVPFGGNSYVAPNVAAANSEYVEAEVERAHLHRELSLQLHEAEHELEIEQASFELAKQMESNAQEYIKMAGLSFDAGEINLMDYLKIQARSQSAINQLAESRVKLQRNIALYNQAVGVLP
ncbi:MAG: TolC family protein [Methyloprofundus sp.]|nr:TolC family protein [Methyloprofundus sp.]